MTEVLIRPRGLPSTTLTDRERTILRHLCLGDSLAQTAYVLGIAQQTVKNHRASVRRKLGIVSVPELVIYAQREGIVVVHGGSQP